MMENEIMADELRKKFVKKANYLLSDEDDELFVQVVAEGLAKLNTEIKELKKENEDLLVSSRRMGCECEEALLRSINKNDVIKQLNSRIEVLEGALKSLPHESCCRWNFVPVSVEYDREFEICNCDKKDLNPKGKRRCGNGKSNS